MALLESRVQNALSSISSVFAENKINVDAQVVKSSENEILPSNPRSREELLKRIHTYSPLTWFAKPDWLSPVHCSRLGWINVEVDLVECISCKSVVSGKLPSSANMSLYEECCKRLKCRLVNSHHTCCPWKSDPTPHDLCRLMLRNRSEEMLLFFDRVQGFSHLGSQLPVIEDSAFESLKLTKTQIMHLCQLVVDQCSSYTSVDPLVLMSACVLSLCGWHILGSSCSSILECEFCDRKIGLWNCFSQTVTDDLEVTDSETEASENEVDEKHLETNSHFRIRESSLEVEKIAVTKEKTNLPPLKVLAKLAAESVGQPVVSKIEGSVLPECLDPVVSKIEDSVLTECLEPVVSKMEDSALPECLEPVVSKIEDSVLPECLEPVVSQIEDSVLPVCLEPVVSEIEDSVLPECLEQRDADNVSKDVIIKTEMDQKALEFCTTDTVNVDFATELGDSDVVPFEMKADEKDDNISVAFDLLAEGENEEHNLHLLPENALQTDVVGDGATTMDPNGAKDNHECKQMDDFTDPCFGAAVEGSESIPDCLEPESAGIFLEEVPEDMVLWSDYSEIDLNADDGTWIPSNVGSVEFSLGEVGGGIEDVECFKPDEAQEVGKTELVDPEVSSDDPVKPGVTGELVETLKDPLGCAQTLDHDYATPAMAAKLPEICSLNSAKRALSPEERDESMSSAKKRRRLLKPNRMYFNPVTQHRPWCIWVKDFAVETRWSPRRSGHVEELIDDKLPWLRLFQLLVQKEEDRQTYRKLQTIWSVVNGF